MIAVCQVCNNQLSVTGKRAGELVRCSCGKLVEVPDAKPYFPEVVRCASCGASLSANSTQCGYCHSLHKPFSKDVYCPECFAFLEEDAKFCSHCGGSVVLLSNSPDQVKLFCPRDGKELRGIAAGTKHAERCDECGGMWMDSASFTQVLEQVKNQEFLVPPNTPKSTFESAIRYVKCPACQTLMNRQNFMKISGVMIDSCYAHGVWLDRDELYQIVSFIRAGGLVEARVFQEEEKIRAANTRKSIPSNTPSSESIDNFAPSFDHFIDGIVQNLFDP